MIITLTGGIASGKSAFAQMLATRGAEVIDFDVLARDVVEPGTRALTKITERWGSGILRADGSLDRPALASIVFTDADALRELEEITHPAIDDRARELIKASNARFIVLDIPLIKRAFLNFDSVVTIAIEASTDTRINRMVRDRNMTDNQAHERINAQLTDIERREFADVIIENSGTVRDLEMLADEVWRTLVVGMAETLESGILVHSGHAPKITPLDNLELHKARLGRVGSTVTLNGTSLFIDVPVDAKRAGWIDLGTELAYASPWHTLRAATRRKMD